MNVNCSAEPCPVILDATCVFYTGGNLLYTGIVTNDNLQTALEKIDAKFQDAAIGYIFQNGIIQTVPGGPVKLGGKLTQDTTINSNGKTLTITEDLIAGKHITTGGTAADFVKGDGSLDNTAYQVIGNYITALTGDGTANGPGSATFTLNNVNAFPGTYGNTTNVPIVTVNSKGLVTSVTTTAITFPPGALIFTGDVTGTGTTGVNTVLTLLNVNSNIYPANTFLKFAVNAKGLVTSATPVTFLDITGTLGYTPVPETRTITINGVTKDLSNNRSWTIGAVWGAITGTLAAQTDLISYLSTTYTPQARTLTINGVTYDLSANRSWTVSTLPSQTGNAGKFLTTDGTTASWSSLPPSGVSAVTASLPISSSGGATPNISISQASGASDGYLSSGDWTTFNSKEPAIAPGTIADYWRGDKTWQPFPTIPTVTPSALTKTDDTNVTLTLTGTPSTALLQAVDLQLGWTGTLADSRISSASTWNAKPNAYYQNTVPVSPVANSFWMNSDTGMLYQYINDGDSVQWVEQTLPIGPQGPQGASGTNNIDSLTTTPLNGILTGNGTTISTLAYTPENVANKSIDGTFAANSDTLYPSQKAVKTYVDNSFPASYADDIDYATLMCERSFFNF